MVCAKYIDNCCFRALKIFLLLMRGGHWIKSTNDSKGNSENVQINIFRISEILK
jgi:hypothetical protein